ncbi:MAG: hypothetical protein AAF916_10245 [Planctomycetota bacterium]
MNTMYLSRTARPGGLAFVPKTWVFAAATTCVGLAADLGSASASTIETTPGLVGFWDFSQAADEVRTSVGTPNAHALDVVGDPIGYNADAPLGGAAVLDGSQFFSIPYAQTADLNISGAGAEVSMLAFLKLDELEGGTTVAGMWYEGSGANDDSGSRQYSLLMNIGPNVGRGKVTPHISSEGGVTRREDGSGLPWNLDYAASAQTIEVDRWMSVGFTYDGEILKAFYNGVFEENPGNPDNPSLDGRNDPYFFEAPGDEYRGLNPYYHGRGIFEYDPAIHSDSKPQGGADFTIGSRFAVGSALKESMVGQIGGLAVFDRALTQSEMLALHDSANLAAFNPVLPEFGLFEDFNNTTGENNVSLSQFSDNTGRAWNAVVGATAQPLPGTSADIIRVANSGLSDVEHFLAFLPDNSGPVGMAWTDDLEPVVTEDIVSISATLNNRSIEDEIRFAIRVDGQWYVSVEAFSMDTPGVGFNDWSQSQEASLAFSSEADAWLELELTPGSALAIGNSSSSDVIGAIDAFGVYAEVGPGGLIRLDALAVVVPEPAAATGLLLAGLAGLRRHRLPSL